MAGDGEQWRRPGSLVGFLTASRSCSCIERIFATKFGPTFAVLERTRGARPPTNTYGHLHLSVSLTLFLRLVIPTFVRSSPRCRRWDRHCHCQIYGQAPRCHTSPAIFQYAWDSRVNGGLGKCIDLSAVVRYLLRSGCGRTWFCFSCFPDVDLGL